MRIALLGDFSGRGSSHASQLASRKPIRVDRDNFEQILAKLEVTLAVPVATVPAPR